MSETLENCGFALLKGENVHVLLRKYEIILGRYSKGSPVDVVLGEVRVGTGGDSSNTCTQCLNMTVCQGHAPTFRSTFWSCDHPLGHQVSDVNNCISSAWMTHGVFAHGVACSTEYSDRNLKDLVLVSCVMCHTDCQTDDGRFSTQQHEANP